LVAATLKLWNRSLPSAISDSCGGQCQRANPQVSTKTRSACDAAPRCAFPASNPNRTSRASCITSMSAPNAGALRALSLRKHCRESHFVRFDPLSSGCPRSRCGTGKAPRRWPEGHRSSEAECAGWLQARRDGQGDKVLGGRLHGVGAEEHDACRRPRSRCLIKRSERLRR
jgi:hypothetical protein